MAESLPPENLRVPVECLIVSVSVLDTDLETHNAGEASAGGQGQPLLMSYQQGTETYNIPAANIAETPTFFLTDICSRQTQTMGTVSIKRSETTLIAAVTRIGMLMLMQWPSMCLSQILARGTH